MKEVIAMRKIWILIICCIIICMNFSTVWGISIQQDIEYQNIIQELEKTPDLYAGYYMDNGILHIVPLNNEKSINGMADLKENANIGSAISSWNSTFIFTVISEPFSITLL